MAIEYAGFVTTQPINWADLTEDLAGKVYQVGAERQKKREELDKIATDNQKLLNSWQPGKNQTLNQLVLRGADQGRTIIKQWNDQLKAGEISAVDYKNKMNNLTEYWGVLANSAKTYDDRYLEIIKRQQDGTASEFEVEMYNMFGNMSNLSDMTTQFDNDGRVYMAKTDKNTGQIIGDIYDVRTMNIPDNIRADKVKVGESVDNLIKGWKPVASPAVLDQYGKVNYESVKNQDGYKVMVERVVNTIAPDANPRAQVSVLVDNGVINAPTYYRTKDEYNQKRNEAIQREIQVKQQAGLKDVNLTKKELEDIDLELIQVTQDERGLIMPVLTEQQRNAAKDGVRQEVGIRVEERIEKEQPRTYRTSGDGTTAADEKEQQRVNEYQRGYMTSLDAFGLDEQGKKTKQPDLSGLDNSYKYRYVNGTIQVYRLNHGKNESPLAIIKSPKGLAQYTVYGKSVAEQEANYELGRTQYRRSKGLDGAPKSTTKTTQTSRAPR
jgi:hypothetical protein